MTEPQEIADYIEPKIAASLALLDSAVKLYRPKMVVGLMSGGDDSIPACYVASLHPAFSGILHVNTGIGIEATREHVRKVCAERKWKLWEYKALENVNAKGQPDPQSYEEYVLTHGFPGSPGHGMMYARLKERQFRRFERDHDSTSASPILFASGMRSQESAKRKRNIKASGPFQKYGRRAFASLIHDWSREDCGYARLYAGIPRNPVSEHIGKSGECLCGAHAEAGELDVIAFWYPETAAYIRDLEKRVKANGFPWGWEQRPPDWWCQMKNGQSDFLADAESIPVEMQHLCHSCNKQAQASEHEELIHKFGCSDITPEQIARLNELDEQA